VIVMRRDKKMTGRSFHSGWRLLHNGPREAKPAFQFIAGWSSPVARQAHNLKVRGSNPLPATKLRPLGQRLSGRFRFRVVRLCRAGQSIEIQGLTVSSRRVLAGRWHTMAHDGTMVRGVFYVKRPFAIWSIARL
jgi:hypothetical protein